MRQYSRICKRRRARAEGESCLCVCVCVCVCVLVCVCVCVYIYVCIIRTYCVLTNPPIRPRHAITWQFFFNIVREVTPGSPLVTTLLIYFLLLNLIFIFPPLYMDFFYQIFFYFFPCDYIVKNKK
jgi:hypothetical protein